MPAPGSEGSEEKGKPEGTQEEKRVRYRHNNDIYPPPRNIMTTKRRRPPPCYLGEYFSLRFFPVISRSFRPTYSSVSFPEEYEKITALRYEFDPILVEKNTIAFPPEHTAHEHEAEQHGKEKRTVKQDKKQPAIHAHPLLCVMSVGCRRSGIRPPGLSGRTQGYSFFLLRAKSIEASIRIATTRTASQTPSIRAAL